MRGLVIRVTDTSIPKPSAIWTNIGCVVDINNLLGRHLGDVGRKRKDVRVGFSKVDKAGGNKEIYELSSLNVRIRCEFSSRASLLTVAILSSCCALRWRTNLITQDKVASAQT